MGSSNPNYIQTAGSKMLKTVLAVCVLLAVVEGSYYGYGGGYGDYGYGGYGGHGYGGYGDYGYGGYGGYGYGGYPGYGYGYSSYPSYSKYKRSVGHGEQVHVSGATGQTVVTAPTHAYGAPAHGSYYAPAHGSYYAPAHGSYYAPNHLSYAPHYPRYGYSDYYHYDPRVTATHAAYSYPRPSTSHSAYPVTAPRHGYSSHGYGNVVYPVNSAYLYSHAQAPGVYGEVDGHHYPSHYYPYNYYPRHY